MELTAPFGYKRVTPLLRETRVVSRDGSLPAFATQNNSLPIVVGEAMVAGHDYPIAFVATTATAYTTVVILGLVTGENLFASPEGWAKGFYVPAYVRRYPYCMSRLHMNGTSQDQSIICVEADAVSDEGAANHDEQGTPTPEFAQMQELISRFETEIARTRELCQILADYKLFEPMVAQIRIGEISYELKGLYRIAEARLEHLMSNQLKTLVRKGAMALIYQHLSSLERFQSLMQRKMLSLEETSKARVTTP